MNRLQIEDEVKRRLQGRIKDAIPEMKTYCIRQGMTEYEAVRTITQVIKTLSDDLKVLSDDLSKKEMSNRVAYEKALEHYEQL